MSSYLVSGRMTYSLSLPSPYPDGAARRAGLEEAEPGAANGSDAVPRSGAALIPTTG